MTDSAPRPVAPLVASMIYGMFKAQALHVVAQLDVAGVLTGGPLDAEELARRCGAHARSLHRLMRYLVGEGVFGRTDDGRFRLNAAAETLRADAAGSMRPMALWYPSPTIWLGWGSLLEAVRNGTSGFRAAHGEELFPHLAKHPDDAALFDAFMTSLVARRPPIHLYDFSGAATVVDVGGGQGATIAAILKAHPHLRGISFDRPELVAGTRESIAAAGLADRCLVVGGSFFDGAPAGGDVYILSNILHDWDDAEALQILGSCRAAMKPGHRLLVAELLVEEDDGPSLAKTIDLQMLAIVGGVQRTLAELQSLFDQTGFGLGRVVAPGLLITTAA
jgi:SAM-dependent methyltransferase